MKEVGSEQLNNLLYQAEQWCPVCGQHFTVTKVRSRLVKLRQDTDFCTYYEGVNLYYYAVWVCEHCGYGAQDAFFEQISQAGVQRLREYLTKNKVHLQVAGERNLFQAVAVYRVALQCAKVIHLPDSRLAGLHMRLAWVYRMADMKNKELAALDTALFHYEQAYLREKTPLLGIMSETALAYVLGELSWRLDRVKQAAHYYSQVVRDREAGQREPRIVELARTAYQELRVVLRAMEATAPQ